MLHEAITSPYVDYEYYTREYCGSKTPKEAFEFHEKKAEALLHRITFDRVKRLPAIPDCVKDAICAMADISFQYSKKPPEIKSENTDGYSVTYSDMDAKKMNAEMNEAARVYLDNTGLLFKGRSRRYDHECGYNRFQ